MAMRTLIDCGSHEERLSLANASFHQHSICGSGTNDAACRYDGPRQWREAIRWAS